MAGSFWHMQVWLAKTFHTDSMAGFSKTLHKLPSQKGTSTKTTCSADSSERLRVRVLIPRDGMRWLSHAAVQPLASSGSPHSSYSPMPAKVRAYTHERLNEKVVFIVVVVVVVATPAMRGARSRSVVVVVVVAVVVVLVGLEVVAGAVVIAAVEATTLRMIIRVISVVFRRTSTVFESCSKAPGMWQLWCPRPSGGVETNMYSQEDACEEMACSTPVRSRS